MCKNPDVSAKAKEERCCWWKWEQYACLMLTGCLTKWAAPCQACPCQAQADTEEGLDLAMLLLLPPLLLGGLQS